MPNAKLQDLAKNYAEGALTFNNYRLQRSQVLDSFSIDLTADQDSPTTLRMKRPTIFSYTSKPFSFKHWLIVAIIILLLLMAGISFFISHSKEDSSTLSNLTPDLIQAPREKINPEKTSPEAKVNAKSFSTPTIIKKQRPQKNLKMLAKQLIKTDIWEFQYINVFQQEWSKLTDKEKLEASNTVWFYQFKYDIFHRIAKYRAQANLGNVATIEKIEDIVGFAKHLGLETIN